MTTTAQLMAIFAFGVVITSLVIMGIARARETEERNKSFGSQKGDKPESS